MLRWAVIAVVVLALGPIGCATQPTPEPPPPTPKPSKFEITGTIELNLTPQIAAETDLPLKITAALEASAHAEVISTNPIHSQHEGKLKLTLTDGTGKQNFANVDIHISGESDGSPDEGLFKVMQHFFDAASLMSKPIATAQDKGK